MAKKIQSLSGLKNVVIFRVNRQGKTVQEPRRSPSLHFSSSLFIWYEKRKIITVANIC